MLRMTERDKLILRHAQDDGFFCCLSFDKLRMTERDELILRHAQDD
jgi:hypothetical protein